MCQSGSGTRVGVGGRRSNETLGRVKQVVIRRGVYGNRNVQTDLEGRGGHGGLLRRRWVILDEVNVK